MKKKVLYICHGNFDLLSRAKRQIESLIKNEYEVFVINGIFTDRNSVIQGNKYSIIRKRILSNKLALVRQLLLWHWNINVAIKYGRKNDLIICRELSVLLSGVIIKLLFQKKLIYDSNELSVETYTGLKKAIWRRIESLLIYFPDAVIHANEERRGYFIERYGIKKYLTRHHVINNYSVLSDLKLESGKNTDNPIKLLYFGGVDSGRGIKELVEVVKGMETVTLDLLGYGSKQYLTEIEKSFAGYTNIRLLPPIDDRRICEYFSNYNIGIAFYPNTQMNNWLCAPNKVWQYIQSGLAVITTNNPPLTRVIDKYRFGVYIEYISEDSLKYALNTIIINKMWENISPEVKYKFSWNSIESDFTHIVTDVMNN